MNKLKILVTGANGLIGSHVVNLLWEKEFNVYGLYRKFPSNKMEHHIINGDLLLDETIKKLKKLNFDVVVHCAAEVPNHFNNSKEIAMRNRYMDDNILELCKEKNCKLIYMSSTSVYGFINGESLVTESFQTNPIGDYSIEKLVTEDKLTRLLPKNSIIFRINAPYGVNQTTNTVLKIFISKALSGEDLFYFGNGGRKQDFTSVYDIALAVYRAILHEEYGIFNIASGNPISMKDLANLVVKSVPGTNSKIYPLNEKDPQEDYRANYNVEKARTQLGWSPEVSIEQGIRNWIKVRLEKQ